MAMHETERPVRVSAVELGSPCTVEIAPSAMLAWAALLPVVDGGLLPGQEVLAALPGWAAARALLIHGLTLRDWITALWLAGRPMPGDAEDFRRWADGQGEAVWTRILAEGARGGLLYYDQHMTPQPEVEERRRRWPSRVPELAELLSDPDLWRECIVAQAQTWDAPLEEVERVLVDLPRLTAAVADALAEVGRRFPHPVSGGSQLFVVAKPGETVERFLRRPVPEEVALLASQTHRLVLVPTVGLGPHLIHEQMDGTLMVWAEPYEAQGREHGSSEEMRRLLSAVASPVGGRVIEFLSSRGTCAAYKIAEHLQLHPSTISRQLKELVELGIAVADSPDRRVVYKLRPESLQPALDWLAGLISSASSDN